MTVTTRRASRYESNTLIITNVPSALFEPSLMACLRAHFSNYGKVRLWAPLKAFGRVLAVFADTCEAKKAKALDKSLIQDAESENSMEAIPTTVIRVFYGSQTPEYLLQSASTEVHLPVPVTDRNFLISPPGSPPLGWEQIAEDPPNTQTLADDLMSALQDLALQQQVDEDEMEGDVAEESPTEEDVNPDTLVIPSPADASFPAVLVSDMDPHAPKPINGITLLNAPRGIPRRPAGRPPISAVKATVESMAGSSLSSGLASHRPTKITPTARPPV